MNEIESQMDAAVLSTWRAAVRATLLLAPRGEVIDVALIADGRVLARHTAPAAQLVAIISSYAGLWQNALNQGRSFVTAISSGGQGNDNPIPVYHGPKGDNLIDVGLTQQILHTGFAGLTNATLAE